ncbi:MAG TPA: hypothetical protein ENI05_08915 [Porticoccus sp.]|nr:hypothetical protein [Porticoccus sp.]
MPCYLCDIQVAGDGCPYCQNGQALYRITGEVELKFGVKLDLEHFGLTKVQVENSIAVESGELHMKWLCVAKAERVTSEVPG